jgi:large subunit ribosomal protein L13e
MGVLNMEARVYKPGTRKRKSRIGRGFSLGELREAGITIQEAKRLGLYIDKRRKSIHKENVEMLREYLQETKG